MKDGIFRYYEKGIKSIAPANYFITNEIIGYPTPSIVKYAVMQPEQIETGKTVFNQCFYLTELNKNDYLLVHAKTGKILLCGQNKTNLRNEAHDAVLYYKMLGVFEKIFSQRVPFPELSNFDESMDICTLHEIQVEIKKIYGV
jgi:hypothetical protein